MIPSRFRLQRLECPCACAINAVAARPWLAAAVLIGLALAAYLPGMLALPPVDRTEIVYADTSRAMLERDDFLDASYMGNRVAFRPIGIYWLQMASGYLLGPDAWGAIATYRLPSLLGGILAVLSMWWLLRPLLGNRASLVAAALFAVTPIVALQATLSIPEGPLLLAIVVAQLALLRLYCAAEAERNTGLALAFWAAQGFGMLLNALAVPILSLATIVALFVFDRRLGWLKRLRPLLGVPLMIAIAAPWMLVRAHFDGVPFSGLAWREFLTALGGAQDMKWKAAPLTFTLAFVLGFMPGALLLVPAIKGLWENRGAALQRFLFCWLVGYLAYLELIASKPALYTVQAMFPAAAAAAALALERASPEAAFHDGKLALPPYMLRLPWPLVLAGMAALFAGVLSFAGSPPSLPVALGAVLVTALFTLAAAAARNDLAAAWLVTSVVGFALFVGFTFGVLLPSLDKGWPAPRIVEAVAPLRSCVAGPVGVVGFREPSLTFLLDRDAEVDAKTVAGWMADRKDAIAVVEDRWHPDLQKELSARGTTLPPRVGCVAAFNTMRGCPLAFSIYATGSATLEPGCSVPARHACTTPAPQPEAAPTSRCR